MATGWDNGLNQDYSRDLGKWFASRLSAREDVRKSLCEDHEWKYDGSGGYGGNRYVCVKCKKTMWT